MRKSIGIPFLALFACQPGGIGDATRQQQALICSEGDVPTYSNTFAPRTGSSGVATAPEAAAGIISSDATGTGSTGAGTLSVAPAVDGTGAPTTAPPSPAADASVSSGQIAAMIATCRTASCAPGQVAVDIPPTPTASSGGTATAGPALAATTTAVADPRTAPES